MGCPSLDPIFAPSHRSQRPNLDILESVHCTQLSSHKMTVNLRRPGWLCEPPSGAYTLQCGFLAQTAQGRRLRTARRERKAMVNWRVVLAVLGGFQPSRNSSSNSQRIGGGKSRGNQATTGTSSKIFQIWGVVWNFPGTFWGLGQNFRPSCAPGGVVTLVIGPLPMRFWRFLRAATETGQPRVSNSYPKTKLEPDPGKWSGNIWKMDPTNRCAQRVPSSSVWHFWCPMAPAKLLRPSISAAVPATWACSTTAGAGAAAGGAAGAVAGPGFKGGKIPGEDATKRGSSLLSSKTTMASPTCPECGTEMMKNW